MKYKDAVLLCKLQHSNGETLENLVSLIKRKGFDILTCIKIIREALEIPLSEAKQLVAGSRAWKVEAEAADPIHEELIIAFTRNFKDGE